jgi:c-di-GMP-binding flagellar brake protein YcgR
VGPERPVSIAPEPDFESSDLLIRSALEVHFVLRTVRDRRALLALHLPDNNDMLFTSILQVDGERGDVVLDYPNDEAGIRRALAADTVVCTTTHEDVKIQFKCEALRKIRFDGREELCCDIPDAVLRVQRRNTFRVQTPQENPLKCVITLPPGALPATAEVTVLDVSCCGVAVIDHHPMLAMDPGAFYDTCRLELPGVGEIEFSMRVRDVHDYTLRNGLTCRRAGCEFVDMPEAMIMVVQRYIIQVEREQNAHRTRLL